LSFVKRYLIPRLVQYFLVILLGITAVFFIPRITPTDPVERAISELRSRGSFIPPEEIEEMIEDLTEMYGLSGSWWEQYLAFWQRLFRGDFGVSFFQFPTPVIELIRRALPWTLGLLLTTMMLSWVSGNIVGGIAGYFSRKPWSRFLDSLTMLVRPIPYYIFSFTLLIVFAYMLKLFPISGGTDIGRRLAFDMASAVDILRHAFLPAMSNIVLGAAVTFQTMKLIVQNVNAENFVQYAKLGGVTESRIVAKYVIRNAILPQITGLALTFGNIFGGALITEMVFSYPGIGTLLYNAIVTGDYNLIMGITSLSIVAITTAILIVDLLYPLFDPRIRHT
jgi:peptide/nickel transport system permease protein